MKKVKQLSPEKQGNVFDTKFQKDWYNSCDEMERAQIGKCCHEVFKIMGFLYLIVMVILCCLAMSGWVEPLWIIVIGLMWLIQQGGLFLLRYKRRLKTSFDVFFVDKKWL